ncbi:hypothetical protein CEXT_639341 [Caerostris extrusa]|uniref:HTH myb-type domain-containing protein n=1 Tax=Caerostris extrusa TaxID=172846 RepID=A0AAV4X3W8_CAEEX|nr:hypothetical protein CEXT_639341 [Caerostris extrusa]
MEKGSFDVRGARCQQRWHALLLERGKRRQQNRLLRVGTLYPSAAALATHAEDPVAAGNESGVLKLKSEAGNKKFVLGSSAFCGSCWE